MSNSIRFFESSSLFVNDAFVILECDGEAAVRLSPPVVFAFFMLGLQ